MEEYIYILIGVIWIAASIYKATKKGKKPAQQRRADAAEGRERQTMPDARSLLEEFLGRQEIKIPEPEVSDIIYDEYEAVRPAKKVSARSFQEEYTNYGLKGLEAMKGEGESSTGRILFKDEMKETRKKSPGQNRINLRKAIIYSTILERPYS